MNKVGNRALSSVYSPEQVEAVRKAASIKAMTMATFVRSAAVAAADEVMKQHQQPA